MQLAEAEPLEGLRLQLDRSFADAPRRVLLARANSRSPVRMATELPQTFCALGTPRRICASSITSSWYSDARWVISMASRRRDDSRVVAGPELGSEQGEHGTDTLAARIEQVAAGDVGEVVGERHLLEQAGLDEFEPRVDGAARAGARRSTRRASPRGPATSSGSLLRRAMGALGVTGEVDSVRTRRSGV